MRYDEYNPNPIALAYKLFPWRAEGDGHESWVLTTALYAIRPVHGYYYLRPFGKVSVSDEGITTWEESDKFRHSYLIPRQDYSYIEDAIDSAIASEMPVKK